MTRDIISRSNRTDPELTTTLVIFFKRDADEQPRRVRYLGCPGQETMWRIEERQHNNDWQTVDVASLEGLQLELPEQMPNSGHSPGNRL